MSVKSRAKELARHEALKSAAMERQRLFRVTHPMISYNPVPDNSETICMVNAALDEGDDQFSQLTFAERADEEPEDFSAYDNVPIKIPYHTWPRKFHKVRLYTECLPAHKLNFIE